MIVERARAWRELMDGRLWSLLLAFLERRSIQACPRSRQTMRASAAANAELVYRLVPASTRPADPGRLAVFGQAWLDLEDWQRAIVLDLVECADEAGWLKGRRWTERIARWELSRPQYERLLLDAWSALSGAARRRGLV